MIYRSDEYYDDYIQTFGTGSIHDLSDKVSRKKKHPLGFAPPKPKTPTKKVK